MKKIFILLMLCLLFVGCSSDGSRELQIDEMKFIPNVDGHENDCKIASSVFEVVPGKYELAWKLVLELPQAKQYDITLTLKLRLKKTVKLKQKVLDKMANTTGVDEMFIRSPFCFYLIDADGNKDETIYWTCPDRDYTTKWVFSKDKAMDFLRFLQSTPGSEIELVLHTPANVNPLQNCIESCKGAKGIVCSVDTDGVFEYDFGEII